MNSTWKKAAAYICISLFALGMPGAVYAGNSMVRVISEYKIAFSYPPIQFDVAVTPLPNGNWLIIYEADNPETAAFWERLGVENMVEQRLEIFDPQGRSLWTQRYRQHAADEDNTLSMIVMEADGFIFEFYNSLEMDTCQRAKRTFEGKSLWFTDRLSLSDAEKRYVTNLNAFRVSVYPFVQSQTIPMEILHQPSGSTARATLMAGSPYGFFEADDKLLILSSSERGKPSCRVFDATCRQTRQLPVPFSQNVSFVLEDDSRLYFFVTEADSPRRCLVYPFHKRRDAFGDVTLSFFIPEGQSFDGIVPCEDGFIVALSDEVTRDTAGRFCGNSQLYHLNRSNTLTLMDDLNQRVVWIQSAGTSKQFTLLLYDALDEAFTLRTYVVNPA